MPRVFISHSSLDHERVEREIISTLRAHSVETWYSTDSIKSASQWERQILTGLRQSDWFLVVLTPRSVTSEWVGREVHWAFLKRKDRIISVMLDTCEPDDLHLGLLPLQFIDFRNELATAQDRLLAIWGLDKATQIETLYHGAREALAQEDWKAAVQHLESVLMLDPAHPQAEAELNHARHHQELTVLYNVGLAHLREKRWHEALVILREVHEIDGNYKDVVNSIALVNDELQTEQAERLYREALRVADRDEWVAAVEQLEAVLELKPSHAEARRALSWVGQQRELVELYTAGRRHLQAQRWREALKSFRRVRAIDKSFRGVADLIAEADAGLDEEIQRSERERPEKEEAERQAREHQAEPARKQLYREALGASGPENWDTARERLQVVTATAPKPSNEEVAARLAEVGHEQLATLFDGGLQHLKNGRWAEALSAFRQVQEADRGYKDVSAQIEQAETELKGLQDRQEQERREQQTREKPVQKGRAAEPKLKHSKFETRHDVELAPAADNTRRKLAKVLAIPIGVLLLGILAFALWPKQHPSRGGNSNATDTKQAASGADSYNRAEALLKQDKYAEAEAQYRKAIEVEANNGDYHNGLGKALYNQAKYKEAEAASRKAVDLNPNKAEYHNWLGEALYEQGKLKEAEVEYHKAINLDPDNALFYKNLANNLSRQNKTKESRVEARKAEIRYRKSIESNPNEAEYYYGLGSTFLKQRRFKEAEAEFRKATDLRPNNYNHHNSLAVALAEQGESKEAEMEYRRAIEIEPNHAAIHFNLGVTLLQLNRVKEGEAELRKATELSPGTALYHSELGYVLQRLKRHQEAKAEHQKAKDLGLNRYRFRSYNTSTGAT